MDDPKKVVINILCTANRISEKMAEALKPYDISIQQFNVLRILRGQKGLPANLSTIQERMVNKMSNTTRLVDKLILKGYVERYTCEENRRKVEIYVTEAGLKMLMEVDLIVSEAEKQIVEELTPEEMDNLNHYLDKIRG